MVSKSHLTVFNISFEKYERVKSIAVVSFSFKVTFLISEDKLFNTVYIPVARVKRFLSWTVTGLLLERSFSNDEKLFLETILNALS